MKRSLLSGVGQDASVLLVDDSPAILALLRDLLKTHGFNDIRTADSVKTALEAVDERAPDVIFLDLLMPDSSGIEFAREASLKSPESRIVVTTALPPTSEAVTLAISQGASEYLPKPLRDEALVAVLDHLAQPRGYQRPDDIGYE